MQAAVEQKDWKPVRITKSAPPMTHLFFADDLLLLGEASVRQAVAVKHILDSFCKELREKVNLSKSRIWYSRSTAGSTIQTITANVGIPSTLDLGKYLGVPLLHSRTHSRQFQYLVDKAAWWMGGWKCKLLSKAPRVILLKSVCQAIPAYAMLSCKLPSQTLARLDKLNRDFL